MGLNLISMQFGSCFVWTYRKAHTYQRPKKEGSSPDTQYWLNNPHPVFKNAFWASKGEETMKPRRGIVRFWPLFSFWLHLFHNWENGKVELERALCQMAYWYPLWATSDGWYGSLKNRPTEWGCDSCPDPVPLEKYRHSLCAKHIGPAHRAEPKRIHGPMSWPFRWSVGPEN